MLKIIAGKPGTGKTYYMMSLLVDHLCDWVRYEKKNGSSFDSGIWTNIKTNDDGLRKTVSDRTGIVDVDPCVYVHYLDESFFRDPHKAYWWEKFPSKSLIVIDEVHYHLGKKVEHGDLDMEEALINYLSMHRHNQQDIYFLSQHTDQFASQALGIADTLLEIVNAKNMVLRFPINIPLADFDVVKESFGIRNQYYQVNIGQYRGKAVRWTGSAERHVMTDEIFRVYKSHTMSDDTSDRPSLKMTPFESAIWFARRHAWHIVPKVGVLACGIGVLLYGPDVVQAGLKKGLKNDKKAETNVTVTETTKPATQSDVVSAVKIVPDPQTVADLEQCRKTTRDYEARIKELEDSKAAADAQAAASAAIVGMYENGVITAKGDRVNVGNPIQYGGNCRCLISVDVAKSTIELDGKEIVVF